MPPAAGAGAGSAATRAADHDEDRHAPPRGGVAEIRHPPGGGPGLRAFEPQADGVQGDHGEAADTRRTPRAGRVGAVSSAAAEQEFARSGTAPGTIPNGNCLPCRPISVDIPTPLETRCLQGPERLPLLSANPGCPDGLSLAMPAPPSPSAADAAHYRSHPRSTTTGRPGGVTKMFLNPVVPRITLSACAINRSCVMSTGGDP